MKSIIRKTGLLLLVVALLLTVPVSCNDTETETTTSPATTTTETPTSSVIQVTDQADREVTLEGIPETIISLSPSNTEILFALGLGDKVVGVTEWCNYPEEAQEKAKIGGFSSTDIDVSIEQIVAIGPDLIVATETHLTEVVPKLEQFVPEAAIIILLTSTESFDVVFDAIELMGEVTGTVEEAALLISEMNDQITAITDITAGLTEEEKPKVLYIVWHEPIYAIGGGTLGNTLIQAAGGINVFGDIDGAPIVDLETIIDKNPDVIIASTSLGTGADLPYYFALNEERLSGINARINNRVYGINDDLYNPGPRLVLALKELAALLHPELFQE